MNKQSRVHGIPLPQSHPAAVERFLAEKVRSDLGKHASLLATVEPMLQIEHEDGDLSGNLTNAYGAVRVNAGGKDITIPFMIVDKELVPFDSIVFQKEEVGYSPDRLQRIVAALDRRAKENDDEEGEIVKHEDIGYDNGFLGSVMDIRDAEYNRNNAARGDLWSGPTFGNMDDARVLEQLANEDATDVLEKLAHAIDQRKVIPAEAVESFLDTIEKTASADLGAAPKRTLEEQRAKRQVQAILDAKLTDVSNVRSGNNIVFPTYSGNSQAAQYQELRGRVYHKVRSLPIERSGSFAPVNALNIKSVVLSSDGDYKFLEAGEKFMMTPKDPGLVKLHVKDADAMVGDRFYTFEYDEQEIAKPFLILKSYTDDVVNRTHVSQYDRSTNTKRPDVLNTPTTVFRDLYAASEVGHNPNSRGSEFIIAVTDHKIDNDMKVMTMTEFQKFILDYATDARDTWLANGILNEMSNGKSAVVLVNAKFEVFELRQAIIGHYKSPEGLLAEGPLEKTAAYEGQNKVFLDVMRDSKPRKYRLRWTFADNVNNMYKMERRQMNNLSEDEAKQYLNALGFNHGKTQTMIEIANRTGRQSIMSLPDIERAKRVAKQDIGRGRREQAMEGVAKNTLNWQSFSNVFSDVMADGLALIGAGVKPLADSNEKVQDFFKNSHEVALEAEKLASTMKGREWYEVATLLNAKYRLDKVAQELHEGNYIEDKIGIFKEAEAFLPFIEKQAKQLRDFNRLQHKKLKNNPAVPYEFVKSALEQLDGLYGYATIEKTAGFKDVVGGFYSTGKKLRADVSSKKKVMEHAVRKADYSQDRINRILDGSATGDLDKAQAGLEKKRERVKTAFREFGEAQRDLSNYDAKNQMKTSLAISSAVVPGVGLAGFLGAKKEGEKR